MYIVVLLVLLRIVDIPRKLSQTITSNTAHAKSRCSGRHLKDKACCRVKMAAKATVRFESVAKRTAMLTRS